MQQYFHLTGVLGRWLYAARRLALLERAIGSKPPRRWLYLAVFRRCTFRQHLRSLHYCFTTASRDMFGRSFKIVKSRILHECISRKFSGVHKRQFPADVVSASLYQLLADCLPTLAYRLPGRMTLPAIWKQRNSQCCSQN